MTKNELYSEIIMSQAFGKQLKNDFINWMFVVSCFTPVTIVTLIATITQNKAFSDSHLLISWLTIQIIGIVIPSIFTFLEFMDNVESLKNKQDYLEHCERLCKKLELGFAYECANKFDMSLRLDEIQNIVNGSQAPDMFGNLLNKKLKDIEYQFEHKEAVKTTITKPFLHTSISLVYVNRHLVITGSLFHD